MRIAWAVLAWLALTAPAWAAGELDAMKGLYVGKYTCTQGDTGLDLLVYQAKNGEPEALFSFYPIRGNEEGIRHGVIRYQGARVGAAGGIVFNTSEWVKQPEPNYTAARLTLTQSKVKSEISGLIAAPGCTSFRIKRLTSFTAQHLAAFEADPQPILAAMQAGKGYPYASGHKLPDLIVNYLSGDEVRALIVGKTHSDVELPVKGRSYDNTKKVTPLLTYYEPDGQLFLMKGQGGAATRWWGFWTLTGNWLCMPGAYMPCARYKRDEQGRLIRVYQNGLEGVVTVTDGGAEVVTEVKKWIREPPPPPKPRGTPGGVLEPNMR